MSPLQWTCKSAAKLAAELQARGHAVSERSVNRLLHALDYSLQSNRKTLEGKGHPDRDAQFQYINRRAKAFQRQGQPVVSVDTKKKELVGQFRTGGREWHPEGQPEEVEVYDFERLAVGLETIVQGVEQPVDRAFANGMPASLELGRQLGRALTRPLEAATWGIPPGHWIDQDFQVTQEVHVVMDQVLPSTPHAAQPPQSLRDGSDFFGVY